MALSGSFNNYPVSGFGLECDWSATQNYIANSSVVTLKVYVRHERISVGERAGSVVSIGGTSETYTAPAIEKDTSGTTRTLIKTKSVTLAHDVDGKKNGVNLLAEWSFNGTYNGVYVGKITASTTVNLNQIDRTAPTVTFTYSNVTSNSFSINVLANKTCKNWEYSLNNGSTWTVFSTAVTSTISYTVTGLTPNSTYNVKARVKRSSNEVVGTSTTTEIKTIGGSKINGAGSLLVDSVYPFFYIDLTGYNSTYTHTLEIKYEGNTLATISGIAGFVGSQIQEISLTSVQRDNILTVMSTLTNIKATLELKTFSGGTQIGDISTVLFDVKTSFAVSAPTWAGTFTFSDTNGVTTAVTGNNSIMVQSQSSLQIIVTGATAKNKATISHYSATVGDKTVISSTNSINFGAVEQAGESLHITVKVVDSRGYYAEDTQQSLLCIPYETPSFTDWLLQRASDIGDLTSIFYSGSFSPVKIAGTSKNYIMDVKLRKKVVSESVWDSWQSLTFLENGSSFNDDGITKRIFDSRSAFDIELKVEDRIASRLISLVLPAGFPLMSFRKNKIGINNNDPQAALDVIGDIIINGVSLCELLNIDPL